MPDKDELNIVAINRNMPPVEVNHADLERLNDESVFKSVCPACGEGVLLVARNPKTFELEERDRCMLCAQTFIYRDIENLRRRERSKLSDTTMLIKHAGLERFGESKYSSLCPACGKGMLPIRRDTKTLELLELDYCSVCQQNFRYYDIDELKKYGDLNALKTELISAMSPIIREQAVLLLTTGVCYYTLDELANVELTRLKAKMNVVHAEYLSCRATLTEQDLEFKVILTLDLDAIDKDTKEPASRRKQ